MPRFREYKYDAWASQMFKVFIASAPKVVAVDTETSGFARQDAAFCVTLSWRTPDGNLESAYIDLEFDMTGTRRKLVQDILRRVPTWVFHNCKFDIQKLDACGALPEGWDYRRIEDTQIIYSLLDENDRKGLKYLAKKILGLETDEEAKLKVVRRKLKIKKDDGYHLLPREVVAPYAIKDTEYTLLLWEKLRPQLPADLEPLYQFMIEFEVALEQIEGHGIGLDLKYLKQAVSDYGVRVMQGELRLQELAQDEKFNPNSPQQILAAFERRGVQLGSTNRETLEKCDDELAGVLLQYRSDKKMHSTYLVPMLKEQTDGIIYPNFNTTLPRTGRMSSSGATNN